MAVAELRLFEKIYSKFAKHCYVTEKLKKKEK